MSYFKNFEMAVIAQSAGKTPLEETGLRAHICGAETNTMKTLKSLTLTASLCALFMSSALALPPWKGGPALEIIQKKSDVEKLGPKSELVLVCKASNTITVIDIKDEKQAKKLCAEGAMIECKDCKNTTKWSGKIHQGRPPALNSKWISSTPMANPACFLPG